SASGPPPRRRCSVEWPLSLQSFSGFWAKGGHVTRKRPAGQWRLPRPAEFALCELRERSRRPAGGSLNVRRHHSEMRRAPVQHSLLQLDEGIDLPRRQAALDQGGAELQERR